MDNEELVDAGLHDLEEELARLRAAGIDGSLRAATFDVARMRLEAACPPEHRAWLDRELADIQAEYAVHEGVGGTDLPAD